MVSLLLVWADFLRPVTADRTQLATTDLVTSVRFR